MTPFDVDAQAQLLFERFAQPSKSALDRLLIAAGIQAYLEEAMPALAKVAREEEGHTWADVGEVLKVTRQAAYQRLGKQTVSYFDGNGGKQSIDPDSPAYIDSLRSALVTLSTEAGREDDVKLLTDYLQRVDAGDDTGMLLPVPVEQEIEVVVEAPAPKARKTRASKTH